MRFSIAGEDRKKQPKTVRQKIVQAAKVSMPYLGLSAMLLVYLLAGASMFMGIEAENEEALIYREMAHITTLEEQLSNLTFEMQSMDDLTYEQYTQIMLPQLQKLAKSYTSPRRPKAPLQTTEKFQEQHWTFRSAVLFALTTISSTGYSHVNLYTDMGKIVTVIYGLIGIPLMFITAANIGKLLSESIMLVCMNLQQKTCKHTQGCHCVKRRTQSFGFPTTDDFEVPASFIIGLILGFCAIGAGLYCFYVPAWDFIHAYLVAFEGMISVTLADVGRTEFDYVLFLIMYRILSLAVLTMCLDLARFKILKMFTKVHYFGRKIKGMRFYAEEDQEPGVDIFMDPRFRSLTMEVIEAIRLEYPEKIEITAEDVIAYLKKMGDKQRALREQYNQAFVPEGFRFFKFADAGQDDLSFGFADSSQDDSNLTVTNSELTVTTETQKKPRNSIAY